MNIVTATTDHISEIRDIALKVWPHTYGSILTSLQIDYMLDMMYSPESLLDQMTNQNHQFLLIGKKEEDRFQGFVSYEFDYKKEDRTKLHKLYVLPECQGTGMGYALVSKVCEAAANYGNRYVSLNMNRQNKTLEFYKRLGFDIVAEEDIDIGNGFLMEDYVFEKQVV